MPASMHTFQAPKGTRDFYPPDLAVRRYVESAWRDVSINHGFDEIDGPTFEHLDLYTVKSGPEIVSELFSFRRSRPPGRNHPGPRSGPVEIPHRDQRRP